MNYLKAGAATAWSLMTLALPAGVASAPQLQPGSDAWSGPAGENIFASPRWDDGKAEISLYTGTTDRYGQARPTEARTILVKEDLLRETLVKSDSGPVAGRTVTAIKLNFIADFPTGTYTYHQMATVMFDRRTFGVLKETVSHTEGCGITFVRVGPKHGVLTHEAHSYWDGEADREVAIHWPQGNHAYADALPVWLRQWMVAKSPVDMKVWLLPGQVSGKSPLASTKPMAAHIVRTDGGRLSVPAGWFTTRRFTVTTTAGTDTYWLDAQYPYVMVRLETAAGRRLALKKTVRLDYWNYRRNEDQNLIDELN